ncbi:MAG: hypothetical protein A2849_02900 [Candidatus Taylorbacteria bacterium RIFCSPHIGHO2_01_FULL_51_15]|uniref:Uncharacterized protein n=1 Tax=Candidatus Taylorbacteria bacterium RIFCSPHIGHO2_01_FULL_51_15 TaxID=1802304 RepID=A0A1G2MB28_9BACT|nr:MAG: hypothetical protein A2849_02900 [Candidatus Taylorbacteria bacterium RIFCSPHIGHO2_01_FULL_51_15]
MTTTFTTCTTAVQSTPIEVSTHYEKLLAVTWEAGTERLREVNAVFSAFQRRHPEFSSEVPERTFAFTSVGPAGIVGKAGLNYLVPRIPLSP